MSKTIPSALQTHLDGEVTSVATCWKITRKDATVYRFTDHDKLLTVSGDDYTPTDGYSAKAIESSGDMSVDNLEILGVLQDASISEADIVAGLFNDAVVELFIVNHQNIANGISELRKGWIGDIQLKRGVFIAELRGLTQRMQQNIGESYSWLCRADLGDARCGVTLASFTVTGTITGVTDNRIFTDSSRTEDDGEFAYGLFTWTTGNNNGLSMEVSKYASDTFTLFENMPYTVQVGDEYSVYSGCDKLKSTCITKFSNINNFRGEPFIPGADKVLRYVLRS